MPQDPPGMAYLTQALTQMAHMVGQIAQSHQALAEKVEKAGRKPKSFKHNTDKDGRIVESLPVWE